MSNSVKSPTQSSSKGFIATVTILVVAIAAVAGLFVWKSSNEPVKNSLAVQEQDDTEFEAAVAENGVVVLGSVEAPKVVEIFEDFSCPHCSDLAKETDEDMLKLLNEKKIAVKIYTLNFLDRGDTSGHSTTTGAAALAIAKSGDAHTFWNFRKTLMLNQDDAYEQSMNAEQVASLAKDLGASDDVVASIKEEKFKDEYLANESANEKTITDRSGKDPWGTPTVYVDGKKVEDPFKWVDEIK